MPDHQVEGDEVARTQACNLAAHRACLHVRGTGGGFNPRRLRLEFGAELCHCSCHSSCPVILTGKRMTVPIKAWQTSCTCPGAEQERHRRDEADERREEVRRRSDVRKEAFQTAKARAAGKSRGEIENIYAAELRERGLKVPAQPVLDAAVDSINGNPLPAARLLGESLVQKGKGHYDVSQRGKHAR